ncbi:protein gvpF/L [Nostoc linckia z18]|uniref:Protein gvpF/L n=2 Tax=Nostoc linckia TaxID=92942 RepID=A0A9Q5ZCJ5_NOSLI|nr:GvpL/GvpF family gas vesicle protein [Nostoc linckia]PHK40956.1 protein gvpF/L [Nostoc linckia z15]PHK46180.1 protein gvpF/L [Nostoc linckia z16]PHJ62922.1 protein gvpF/L [Nostoc linckia z1]PHJ66801.1 protein gvpF/L [Nostoc linckia z3]PHJ70215.1 protein gvpF/L [Nostoc linckia z2]
MSYGFYIYGILTLPAPQDLNLEGLDRQPVQIKILDDFAVIYSEAQQERYLASRRNLLSHEKVLEEIMQTGDGNLLPVQFGLLVANWETFSEQLIRPHQQELTQLLAKLSGRREVSVKVFWDTKAEIQGLLAEHPNLKTERDKLAGQPLSMEQVIQIGQAIEQGMSDRKQGIINLFQGTLNSIAIDVVENTPQMDTMIYNAAYLIPWEAESQFSEQVEALDRQFEERLRIRYNNFTAPFNFARLRLFSSN